MYNTFYMSVTDVMPVYMPVSENHTPPENYIIRNIGLLSTKSGAG